MFVYAVAKAVNEGWIPQRYITIAQFGWNGLTKKVTPDGQIPDICIGTSIEEDILFYYNRPRETNDTHGLGAFLMAGAEMLRANEKLVDLQKKR
jgi:rhamnogalacturonyl hydrolase YesR